MDVWGGVDFGGTNIKLGLVTRQGRVTAQTALSTQQHADPSTFVRGVASALRSLAHANGTRLRGVGIGAPGLIDPIQGVIHRLTNVLGGWHGIRLARLIQQRLGRPCVVDNDVNVTALGEWRFGAGRGTCHSLYVTLGTGVGGGVIINGTLVRGATGSAGEIGHTTIACDGPRCACGRRGCLEAFVGTAAILARARAAIRAGNPMLPKLLNGPPKHRLTPELVSRAAQLGDRASRTIWRDVGCYLGIGLASAVNLLNPERIVIGGGIANAWPWFAPTLTATVRREAFDVPGQAARIVRAQLGDRAGIIGGACLMWEQEQVKGVRC